MAQRKNMGHTQFQPPTFSPFVDHLSKKFFWFYFLLEENSKKIKEMNGFLPKSINSFLLIFFYFLPFFYLLQNFKVSFCKNSNSTHFNSNGIHINSKQEDFSYCLHHYILAGNQLYVSKPPIQEEKSIIWKSHVLIPFTISDITHAFSGPPWS